MGDLTPRLDLYLPGGGSSGTIADEPADIDKLNDNFRRLDEVIGARTVTSTSRPPDPYDGQLIRETNTGDLLIYDGATTEWVVVLDRDPGPKNEDWFTPVGGYTTTAEELYLDRNLVQGYLAVAKTNTGVAWPAGSAFTLGTVADNYCPIGNRAYIGGVMSDGSQIIAVISGSGTVTLYGAAGKGGTLTAILAGPWMKKAGPV